MKNLKYDFMIMNQEYMYKIMISIPDLLGCLYQTKVKTAKPMGSHFLMTAHLPPGRFMDL